MSIFSSIGSDVSGFASDTVNFTKAMVSVEATAVVQAVEDVGNAIVTLGTAVATTVATDATDYANDVVNLPENAAAATKSVIDEGATLAEGAVNGDPTGPAANNGAAAQVAADSIDT